MQELCFLSKVQFWSYQSCSEIFHNSLLLTEESLLKVTLHIWFFFYWYILRTLNSPKLDHCSYFTRKFCFSFEGMRLNEWLWLGWAEVNTFVFCAYSWTCLGCLRYPGFVLRGCGGLNNLRLEGLSNLQSWQCRGPGQGSLKEGMASTEPDRPYSPLVWPGSFSAALTADAVFVSKIRQTEEGCQDCKSVFKCRRTCLPKSLLVFKNITQWNSLTL